MVFLTVFFLVILVINFGFETTELLDYFRLHLMNPTPPMRSGFSVYNVTANTIRVLTEQQYNYCKKGEPR